MWDETDAGSGKAGYRVLARKYRPSDFTDLIGQEPMVRTLTNAFETGRIAQAYMLTGVRGVGKTTTARILARALNYQSESVDRPTIDLSVPGEHCQAIIEGRHVDVIEMDAASHTGIDDIREIIEQVRYRPAAARYKVYIIDEVHMLSTQAFNGLLKTLEEPPAHAKFIFATTEIRKVPITVLSRCQRFDLRRIEAGALVAHFRRIAEAEGIPADDLSLAMIARAAEGSARDGLSLMDQAIAHGGSRIESDAVRAMLGLADRGRIIDLFEHVARGDVAAALGEFHTQYASGANPPVVLTDLAEFAHLVTRLKFVPDAVRDPSLSEAERTRGADFAAALGVPVLSRLWQMLLKGITETEESSKPYACAEMVLIRLTHAASLPGPEEAARRLDELSDKNGFNGGGRQQADPPQTTTATSPASSSSGSLPASAAPRSLARAPASGNLATAGLAAPIETTAATAVAPQEPAVTAEPENGALDVPSMDMPPAASGLQGLEDIVALASDHRDIKMKTLVRNCLRLVRLEPGRIEAALAPDTPKTFLGDLGVALERWTGRRWILTLSREEGSPTLAEQEAAARDMLVRDARQDPDVAAILEHFPGARIIDVRIAADEPLALAESSEGDVLPDTPDSTSSGDE